MNITFNEFIASFSDGMITDYFKMIFFVSRERGISDSTILSYLNNSKSLEDWLHDVIDWIDADGAESRYNWNMIKRGFNI
jgi:hypothetical protein